MGRCRYIYIYIYKEDGVVARGRNLGLSLDTNNSTLVQLLASRRQVDVV